MPEINGIEPQLVGRPLGALLVQQYWHCGKLEEPANVTYLCVDSQWYRLYFDYGVVFWRSDAEPPDTDAESEPGVDFAYPFVDLGTQLGIVGCQVIDIRTFARDDCDAAVEISFGVATITLVSANDVTTIETSSAAHRGT